MKASSQFLFILIAITFSCSDEEPGSNPPNHEPAITAVGTPVGDPVTKTIGTSGGSIASPDGVMELTIPAGALSINTAITIQPVTNKAPGGIGVAYDLLPNGTTFSKPATLTFHYTEEDVNGSNPLFLYIAYQDISGAWVSDLKNQLLDSLAQTISLDISHFTINSMGADWPKIVPQPDIVKAGKTSRLFVAETFVIEGSDGETRSQSLPVGNNIVGEWKVNSIAGGNSTVGTIEGTGAIVTYRAPVYIETRRVVKVSTHVNVTITTYINRKRVVIKGLDLSANITLEPEPPRKYFVLINYVDSTVSPFYSPLNTDIPVYSDFASFNLDVAINNRNVEATDSEIHNEAPTVNPATRSLHGTDFIWIPDPNGVMNIDEVTLSPFTLLDKDSILVFNIQHKNANACGFITQSSGDGQIFVNSPPIPFGGGIGIPLVFEVDLKKKGLQLDRSQPQDIGRHTVIAISPRE